MKKIINGKVYDTETATEVRSYERGNVSDFHYIQEILYKTKRGSWFLYRDAGALSGYGGSLPNNGGWYGTENIEAMDNEEAFEWLSRHDAELAMEYFSDTVEEA
ncbi:MAG: hypothetical protein OWR52_10220 [Acidibacillus sp.]|nr:hypothetical protein [Acidibacillus sp.]